MDLVCNFRAVLALMVGLGATNTFAHRSRGPTVSLHGGLVVGTTTSLHSASATVNQFLGIPYAKSPPERFSPPEDAQPWSQPLDASQLTPACIQQFVYPKKAQEFAESLFNQPPPPESEDCL